VLTVLLAAGGAEAPFAPEAGRRCVRPDMTGEQRGGSDGYRSCGSVRASFCRRCVCESCWCGRRCGCTDCRRRPVKQPRDFCTAERSFNWTERALPMKIRGPNLPRI
jgi:hypothetical protein